MALFQPTNVTPSDINGTGTIDVTQDFSLSWQVNGTSPMTAYQIRIFQNDTDSTLKYDTGKVVLTEPFYGNDRMGNPQFFGAVIAHALIESAGIVNGYANGYKFLVKQWWSDSDYIEQTSANAFITRKKPVLTIETFPTVIDTKEYDFSATYSQEQGDAIEWVQWQIANGASTDDLLLDTGKITTSYLETSYDGFLTGQTYMIRCMIQTENGVQETTEWKTFTVQYELTSLSGACKACGQCDHDAVKVTFPENFSVVGEGHGEWSIIGEEDEKVLSLPSSSDYVVWNTSNDEGLVLKAPFSIAWSGIVNDTSSDDVIFSGKMGDDTFTVTVRQNGAVIRKNSDVIGSFNESIYSGDILYVMLEPDGWKIKRITEHDGALLPSVSLYPGLTLYPSSGSHAEYEYEGTLSNWQSDMNEIRVNGNTYVNYVWVVNGAFTQEQEDEIYSGEKPERDAETLFLADFESGLNAGAVDVTDVIEYFDVYRREQGETVIRHIAKIPSSDASFYDFSACSQRTYTYVIYGIQSDGAVTTPFTSDPVTPFFWNWTILCCADDEDGRMRVRDEYRFALDVSSGTISNNNSPSLQKNFTLYPTRQPISTNYRSGTLSAFVGKAKDGKLIDSIDLINELYGLSVSENTKYLKNRKGNIYMVETNGAVTMNTEDKYAAQPCKAEIPWVETGKADRYPIALESDTVIA